MICRKTFESSAARLVLIRNQNCRRDKKKLMLIDTGAIENYIRRSVVDELGLAIEPGCPIVSTGLNGYKFTSRGHVEPEWRFSDPPIPKEHPRFQFHIVDEIPGGFDILLGRVSAQLMGIHLCIDESGVCVAHQDPEGSFCPLSSSVPRLVTDTTTSIDTVARKHRQQQRISQNHDIIESENKIRQAFEAEIAELIEQREAAAKASDHTKPAISTSHKDVCDSRDVRR